MGLTNDRREDRTLWPGTEAVLRELRQLAAGRLCQGEERRRCRFENGPFADWACQVCQDYLRPEAVSPWSWHLLFLHRLKKAGYPFRANDLSLETWLLLGLVEEALTMPQGERHAQRPRL